MKSYRVVVIDVPTTGSAAARIAADVVTAGPPAVARVEAEKSAPPLAPGYARQSIVNVYRSAP